MDAKDSEIDAYTKRHTSSESSVLRELAEAAGRELEPILMQLGAWSLRWVYDGMSEDELNVDSLVRDIANHLAVDRLPRGRTVLHFRFTDVECSPEWYLVVEEGKVEYCDDKLMLDVDVYFTGSLKTVAEVWMGDRGLEEARDRGDLRIVGDQGLLRNLRQWLGLLPYATMPRGRPVDA